MAVRKTIDETIEATRLACEADLATFITVVHPGRVLGAIHRELIRWITREDAMSHQMVLLPRDHQKSAIAAYYAAWCVVRNPAIRILYISSTAQLAIKQLKFIKDILTSKKFRLYWPDMVNVDEGRREKWSETEIAVDHPKRKQEYIREATVFTAGLTTNTVGLHCDLCVLDDVVVYDTAYTEDGRSRLETQYSLLASIEGTDAKELVVGTRYNAKDLYGTLLEKRVRQFNENGEVVSERDLYEVFERAVEDHGDGTGEFLWPRQQRPDGRWFGFNADILETKRTQYLDQSQFRAQYYNNPNYDEDSVIRTEYFQYYDRAFLSRQNGFWYIKGRRLNLFASVDFAFSLGKKSDYTAIVVVGVDADQNYYVLDIDRFKTNLHSEYFQRILNLYRKWEFRKLIAEVTAGQAVIVEDLKQNYIRVYGLALSVEDVRPTGKQGSKEERVRAILQPRYSNRQIWHYQGGLCQVLEEELVQAHPSHDDVKDALASAVIACRPPSRNSSFGKLNVETDRPRLQANARFGGFA